MHGMKETQPMLEGYGAINEDDRSTISDLSSPENETRLEPKEGLAKFRLHLRLLLYKNVLLFWRSKKVTLFQLLTPILCSLVMLILQIIANNFQDETYPNPPTEILPMMPKCRGKD